ncbi:putative trans-sialidase [Trypanosoma cruzi]|nr:putative trans-sialidase [Trypanosoma cruzi]
MAEGDVPHDDEDERKMGFAWHGSGTSNLDSFLKDFKPIPKPFRQLLGGGGAGIRLGDDFSVLPTHALKDDGKVVSLVILAKGFTYEWEFSRDTSPAGCIRPAVLAWKDRDLVTMTSSADGSRGVYTSDEKGESVDGGIRHSFARVGHGVQGGFVSATIDGQKVILVSRPVCSETDGKEETRRLHLWLSDLRRIYDVGPVSAVGEKVAASTLPHSIELQVRKDPIEARRLYCSYEVAAAEDGEYNITFVDMTEKLEDMKEVLAAWKERDAQIAKEYRCGNKKNNWRSECDDGDLTKGLVGLLSSTSTDSTWRDEYLCVNAAVCGGVESTPDGGLTFKGPGAGAERPVGDMGPNQPYHFADKNFTPHGDGVRPRGAESRQQQLYPFDGCEAT